MKKLRVWNGRGFMKNGKQIGHLNVCAYSKADAIKLINEYAGWKNACSYNEITHYFSECWGNSMDGITPERGLWVEWRYGDKPERVV